MANKEQAHKKVIAVNRKARFNFEIEEIIESGIVLTGSELKSLRLGKANISDAFADETKGEIFLYNSYIAEYKGANQFNHDPTRPRKLLLHKQQIRKLFGKLKIKGYTITPISLYFNDKNKVKIEIGIGKGKKLFDKRQTEKERDWHRDKQRMLKNST